MQSAKSERYKIKPQPGTIKQALDEDKELSKSLKRSLDSLIREKNLSKEKELLLANCALEDKFNLFSSELKDPEICSLIGEWGNYMKKSLEKEETLRSSSEIKFIADCADNLVKDYHPKISLYYKNLMREWDNRNSREEAKLNQYRNARDRFVEALRDDYELKRLSDLEGILSNLLENEIAHSARMINLNSRTLEFAGEVEIDEVAEKMTENYFKSVKY